MNNYTPFLKLKSNEIMAFKELGASLKVACVPFFDIPKDDQLSEDEFKNKLIKLHKKVTTHLKDISNMYLDNFDLDTRFNIDGNNNYKYILELFCNIPIIPVVSLDRSTEHIASVINAKTTNVISSKTLAIRLTYEDFENFELIEDDFEDMLEDVIDKFEAIDLIFDTRITTEHNMSTLPLIILDFVEKISNKYTLSKIVVTGSSIPSSIADVVSTEESMTITRSELVLISKLEEINNLYIGDYTIVSPNYSEVSLPGNVMYNVMTPKTVYSYDNKHYFIRGGSLKTHPDGSSQFNEQARVIMSKPFYRGQHYSFGDSFIEEKSRNTGSSVMPGTILKPTINAHMTYMLLDYTD